MFKLSYNSCRIYFKTFSSIVKTARAEPQFPALFQRQRRQNLVARHQEIGGAEGTRTLNILLAKQVLGPVELRPRMVVGVLGFEPRTSSLSGTRSNQLSYTPRTPQMTLCQTTLRADRTLNSTM